MYAHDLFEAGKPNIVVTYPGRFQPFHQGHAGVFAQLQKKFGRDAVYILTSNDQSSAKSPFNFTDKYQLITAAGVHGDRIIETNKMYVLPEGFNPSNTIFITAVGAPDADRLNPDTVLKRDRKDAEGNIIKAAGSPSYYKIWDDKNQPVTADQHGYVIVIPEIKKSIKLNGQEHDVSHGTECRNLWNQVRDNKEAADIFLKQLYGKATPELEHIFNKIPVVNEDVDLDSADTTSPVSEARIIDPDSKMDLYYVTRSGQKQIVFRGIPQNMLEKAVMVLRTKYPQIKITDIEMRPSDVTQYRRSSQPELAEDSNKFILYVNNEPAAKYVNVDDARLMRDNLKKKYPSAKIELKQEKCDLINIKEQSVAEGSLNEFAPSGGDEGNDGFSEETLKMLAAQWYNGDEDPRVERTLMAAGWEIGQDEGYDDEPGVFVVQAGDTNGDSYLSWSAHELRQGVAEGAGNITAIFSGYSNYMDGRAANVFKHYGITVLGRQHSEDEDISEYTVTGSKEALDKARAYLERSEQFGGMILQQGVTEGLNDKLEAGDKITWYYSNQYPKIEGTVVGWKDGHLVVKSIDPSPRNTEKTVTTYRVPKNNILSVEKQGVAEDAAGVGVVAKNKKMAKDPRYSMSMTKDVKPNTPKDMLRAFRLAEDEDFGDFDAAVRQLKESKENTPEFPELLAKFLPLAMQTLKLKHLPEIKLEKHVDTHDGQATFGRYINEEGVIHLAIADRHPLDILRTLAHELCHYKQDTLKELTSGSGRTGSPEENEAHVMAGIIMRHFNKKYPNLIKLNPINMK